MTKEVVNSTKGIRICCYLSILMENVSLINRLKSGKDLVTTWDPPPFKPQYRIRNPSSRITYSWLLIF